VTKISPKIFKVLYGKSITGEVSISRGKLVYYGVGDTIPSFAETTKLTNDLKMHLVNKLNLNIVVSTFKGGCAAGIGVIPYGHNKDEFEAIVALAEDLVLKGKF